MTEEARQIVEDLRWFISYYPKWNSVDPCETLSDAADLIKRLSAELEAAKSDISAFLQYRASTCDLCKYRADYDAGECKKYCGKEAEWRGLCSENGGADK